MIPIKKVTGRGMPIVIDDIDTDRIIPSRFLRCVTFDGIGDNVFYDERFNERKEPTNFPMNDALFEGATIILSGKNFGCGSSREHAPQAIKRAGFKAVIAESFSEIFFGNSLTIGLLCVVMSKSDIAVICRHLVEQPKEEIVISIDNLTAEFRGNIYNINIPTAARRALMSGRYDLLSELLANKENVASIEKNLPY